MKKESFIWRCLLLLAVFLALASCRDKTADELGIFAAALKQELRIHKSPIYPTIIVVQDLRAGPPGRWTDPPDTLIADLRSSGLQVFKLSEIQGAQRSQVVAFCIAQLTKLTDDRRAEVTLLHGNLMLDEPEIPISGSAGMFAVAARWA